MPMVVYTEDEVIEKCNEAEASGAAGAAADRDKAMAEKNSSASRMLSAAPIRIRILAKREKPSAMKAP